MNGGCISELEEGMVSEASSQAHELSAHKSVKLHDCRSLVSMHDLYLLPDEDVAEAWDHYRPDIRHGCLRI